MPRMRVCNSNSNGTATIAVLLAVVVLSFAAATVLKMSVARYQNTMQAGSWQEAVYSAEAGADLAVVALQGGDWSAWRDGAGGTVTDPPPSSATSPPAAGEVRVYKGLLAHTAGQGGGQSALVVEIDAPSSLIDGAGQWYRVRSTGVAAIPGQRGMGFDPGLFLDDGTRQDFRQKLRRYAFASDRSGGLIANSAQAVRTVETIIKPVSPSPWTRALTLKNTASMSGGWIDSFDSADPAKSTGGLYDVAKRQWNGTVGTTNSTGSNLGDAFVYGDLKFSGPAIAGTTNVQGAITSPFTETIAPVATPTWGSYNVSPTQVNTTTTLTGGPAGSPQRYKLSELTVSGGKVLTLQPHAAGEESYVEIWVTGDMTTSGSGFITQQPGVHVTYYVEQNISVTGSSFNNQSNIAANNQIYGVTPASGTKSLTVSGGGTFIGAVNAPDFDITISGGASLSGSFIANTISISGGGSVHYDEALSRIGGGTGSATFTVASWAEDAY